MKILDFGFWILDCQGPIGRSLTQRVKGWKAGRFHANAQTSENENRHSQSSLPHSAPPHVESLAVAAHPLQRVKPSAFPNSSNILSIQNPKSKIQNSQSGVALVIILAFVVLLTVMVLAYFSYTALQRQISQASINQTTAEIFAEGAVNTIVGDLRQEIVDGSAATNIVTGSITNTIYYPLSPTNAVPALVGSSGTNGLENLVKRSASGLAFYPGGTNRAAAVSTTNASQNGRYLSPARWNAALLLPKANTSPTNTTDFTPTNTFTPPDWILVARDGSNPTAWNDAMRWSATNAATVVGRYAYAIYDEGGLLDMNAAGYPPGSSTNLTADKGSLATADLSVIPGMTANAIAALVGWRNYASSQPGGSFPAYTFDAAAQTNYFKAVQTNTSGFLRTANTNLVGGQSDRQFVSRQQLIQFLTQAAAANDTDKAALQNALQYLGTFTRDLEQPSFNPEPNLPMPANPNDPKARPKNHYLFDTDNSNDTCGDTINGSDVSGAKQDQINPFLPAVIDSNGQPVMKRRFPLSRLALLTPNPPAADAAKIKDYFGLEWKAGNNRWEYNHGDPNRILSLYDPDPSKKCVARENREPDFFETLKAVINCDSLGKQHGFNEVDPSSIQPAPHSATGSRIDGQIHNQLIQIAANLIDQYDTDSYPTCLFFNNREYFGVENLPYLAGWQQMWYRMRALVPGTDISTTIGTPPTAAEGTTYETSVMIQPIIWNPHVPDSNPNPPDVPTEFRVVASSMTDGAIFETPQVQKAWWVSGYPTTYPWVGGLASYPDALIDPATSILTFNTGSGDAAFREPFRLRAPNYPAGSNAAAYPAGQISHADSNLVAAGEPATVIGFFCGQAWTGPSIDEDKAPPNNNTQKWLSVGRLRRDLKLMLQYKLSGSWLTYDVIGLVYNASGNVSTVDNTDIFPYLRAFRSCFRADPRTNRWGLFQMAVWPSTNPGDTPSGITPLQAVGDNGVDGGPGVGNNSAPHQYLPQGITLKPNQNSTYLMGGASGLGLAAAPGWASWALAPSDLTVNWPARSPLPNPNLGTSTTPQPGQKYCYTDPDGVFRRGSGWNFTGNDGFPLYTGNYNSRPVILNRPFRSISEMSYAFRGVAWKEIDFFSPESGDAALLDAFCLNDLDNAPGDVSVAGRVNLNTRQPKVLEAILRGVSKAEGGTLTDTEAKNGAQALVNWTSDTTSNTSGILNKGPLRNRSELAGKFVYQVSFTPALSLTGAQSPVIDGSRSYSGFSSVLTSASGGVFANPADRSIKRRAESVLRALADSGNARTWNLLIDLVAQVGRYPAHATSLNQFSVEGETRQWIHLAIDRYTGLVIAKQIEPVSE